MKAIFKPVIIFVVFLQINGCDFNEIKSVATSGEMFIVVDENVVPLMEDEIAEFERLNKEAKVIMKSEPTSNAIVDFINKDTKLIVVSRNLNEEERKIVEKNKHRLIMDN